jgi:hypothetical protein
MAEDLEYVPLPKNIVVDIENVWAGRIRDAGGKPLYAVAP